MLALWDEAGFREERYAALALARHRLHREHRQAHTIEPLRAPAPHRRLVGPRRRDLHPPGPRAGAGPPGRGEAGHPGVGGGRRPVGTPQRDHLPGRRQGRARPVTAGRGDRGEPRRVDADHTRPLAVRPGVLHPQGDRLGPARPRARRPRLGAVPSWTATTTSSPACRDARRSSTSPRDSAVDVADPRRRPAPELVAVEAEHLVEDAVLVDVRRCPGRRCAWRR